MIEKRGVEDPDLGELANLDNPGKTAEIKQPSKKKNSNWPLILLALGGVGYYLWDRAKKKEKESVLALAAQAQTAQFIPQQQQQQTRTTPARPSLPGSAESRLRGMGVNPDIPSPYQSDESYKEL